MLPCKAADHTLAQLITQWSLHVKAWVRSQGSSYEILSKQDALEGGFSPSTLFSHQYHFTNAPYLHFITLLLTVYNISN